MNYCHSGLPHSDRVCEEMSNQHVGETFNNISSANSHAHDYNRFADTHGLVNHITSSNQSSNGAQLYNPGNRTDYTHSQSVCNQIECNQIPDNGNRVEFNQLHNLGARNDQMYNQSSWNEHHQTYDYEVIKCQDSTLR